ncbi:hypothetical protein BDZ89DRAFT_1050727 [Hymenopellis radicata]|nr:hypothetical protein BDZ89DRAFT_1053874 [Hymenopellis radicata]KAF9001033.1 hypothetical protein BDZ89DRAFT_1050727 [Hymenopellis radicata]
MSGVKQQLLAILLFLSFTLVTMPKGELPPPCLPSRLLFLHPPRSLLQHCGSVDSGPTLSLLPKSTAGVVFSVALIAPPFHCQNPSFFDPPKALWGDHGELDDPPDSPDHALGLCADGVELKVERASTPAKPLYFIFTLFTLLPQLSTDVGHLVVIGRTSMLVFSFFERLQDFADVSTSHDGVAISKARLQSRVHALLIAVSCLSSKLSRSSSEPMGLLNEGISSAMMGDEKMGPRDNGWRCRQVKRSKSN